MVGREAGRGEAWLGVLQVKRLGGERGRERPRGRHERGKWQIEGVGRVAEPLGVKAV